MADRRVTLVEVFDSDLDELLAMKLRSFSSRLAEIYAAVQIAYLSGNDEGLRGLIDSVCRDLALEESQRNLLETVVRARYQLRTRQIDVGTFRKLEAFIEEFGEWKGEIYFILANRATAEKCYDLALIYSERSWKSLEKQGARKKAVRALMNHLAAESCLHPQKHYLSDLYFVYREAKKTGDRTSIGTTLLNLSREYQKLGAYSTALKYVNRAVATLAKNAGNLAFYYALAHRCHLFCQLGAFADARGDAEVVLCSRFPEAHAAIEVLTADYPELLPNRSATPLLGNPAEARTFTWNERRSEKKAVKLTKLEQKVLELLSEKPRSKVDLIEHLYGTRLERSVTENRLNNLLARIRKRFPGLVIHAEGKYRMKEEAYFRTDVA